MQFLAGKPFPDQTIAWGYCYMAFITWISTLILPLQPNHGTLQHQ
jgi:hypothetical protein